MNVNIPGFVIYVDVIIYLLLYDGSIFSATKKYITETTKLMNGWTNNSPLKDIAFKAIYISCPVFLFKTQAKHLKQKII